MKDNFQNRLIEYRKSLNIRTKRAMAKRLDIKESLYSMLESGDRTPSKDVLTKLFLDSKKPEEYWLYGIDEDEYVDKREEFKSSRDAIEQLYNLGLLDENTCTEGAKEVLLAAALADAVHIILKMKGETK